jgi:hypothetical protein
LKNTRKKFQKKSKVKNPIKSKVKNPIKSKVKNPYKIQNFGRFWTTHIFEMVRAIFHWNTME